MRIAYETMGNLVVKRIFDDSDVLVGEIPVPFKDAVDNQETKPLMDGILQAMSEDLKSLMTQVDTKIDSGNYEVGQEINMALAKLSTFDRIIEAITLGE
jgi:hypothetical protein